MIAELKKRSCSINSTQPETKLNKSNSEDKISSLNSSRNNTPKFVSKPRAFSPFSSKESLNTSSENIIENAKKSLNKIGLKRPSKPAHLIYSANNNSTNTTNDSGGLFEFQQATLNRIIQKSPSKYESQPKITEEVNDVLSKKNLKPVKTESIIIPAELTTNPVHQLKTNNESSTTITTSSSTQNFGSFLSSSSSNTSINEKLTKPHNTEPPIHIYDNAFSGTMPENAKKSIGKTNSAPESFVYKLSKKQNENKTYFNKMTLGDRGPEEVTLSPFKAQLRLIKSNNSSKSYEDINEKNPVNKSLANNESDSYLPKKLAYSKSLKVDQSVTTNNVTTSNSRESQIDIVHDYRPRNSVPCRVKSNKIILVPKIDVIQNNVKPINEIEQPEPIKKVADLIKNLNGEKNSPTIPIWKDLALKKKNAW